MAAFTTLALLGLAAGAGAFAGKKLLAPKPTTAGTLATGADATPLTPTPPPTADAGGQSGIAAQMAGRRQRRRSTAGGTRSARSPVSLAGSAAEPRSLIGF